MGVLFAIYVKNVLQAFLFLETMAAFMGIMVFGGVLWKRANRYGAISGVSTAFIVYYYLNFQTSGKLEIVYDWLPDLFGWALLAGFVVFFLVSILTKEEDRERIDKFFDNLDRLSDDDKKKNGKKPLAAEYGQELILLDISTWFKKERWTNFLTRYREDVMGFLYAWLFVGGLILLAWAMLQIK
jgi:Na+/proline symporter